MVEYFLIRRKFKFSFENSTLLKLRNKKIKTDFLQYLARKDIALFLGI